MANKDEAGALGAAGQGEVLPNRGPVEDPNPGERPSRREIIEAPLQALGINPAGVPRGPGGKQIGVGAMVGIMRNLEFTAGGRAHRMITGTHSNNRPAFDPKSGRIHTCTATDTGDPSVGEKSPRGGQQPAMIPHVEGAGATIDTSTGDVTPDRYRDRRTP